MEQMKQIVFGNTLSQWAIAMLVLVLVAIGFEITKKLILRRIAKSEKLQSKGFDQLIRNLLEDTRRYFVFVIALYLGTLTLSLPEFLANAIRNLVIAIILLQAGFWGMSLIDYFVNQRVHARPDKEHEVATAMNAVRLVAKITLWVVVGLLILENLTGIQVGTLLATLGIGGIAIALAVQGILGDLFASVSISLDRPFAIGDNISIDGMSGTVEEIGLKSTRIRSVSGEQLIISNSDLLSSRLRNFRRMDRRRVLFTLSVTYQTPSEKLAEIPEMLQKIILTHEYTTFDHATFQSFGDSALIFEVVYFYETPDNDVYIQTHHAINLEILKKFEAEGIKLAHPTRTIFMEHLAE
jgi:small-conductance mechanosensitive channel